MLKKAKCQEWQWQNLDYTTQLFYKQQQVIDNLERLGGLTLPGIKPIVPSQKIKYYRNKLEFSFTSYRWYTKEEMDSEVAMAMYDSSIGKSEDYYSDDEDMDKWSNIEKKCWVGYTQRGMKDKGGRMVPNCVPVGKSEEMEDEKEEK